MLTEQEYNELTDGEKVAYLRLLERDVIQARRELERKQQLALIQNQESKVDEKEEALFNSGARFLTRLENARAKQATQQARG